jgi:hypothetical protein
MIKDENSIDREGLKKLLAKDEQPILNEIKGMGINIESIWDLVNNRPNPYLKTNFTGDYSIVYPILVKHLDYRHHPKTIEGILRALTEKPAKEIATAKILEMFYKETNKNLKWVMANALKTLMSWKSRQKHPEIEKTFKGL